MRKGENHGESQESLLNLARVWRQTGGGRADLAPSTIPSIYPPIGLSEPTFRAIQIRRGTKRRGAQTPTFTTALSAAHLLQTLSPKSPSRRAHRRPRRPRRPRRCSRAAAQATAPRRNRRAPRLSSRYASLPGLSWYPPRTTSCRPSRAHAHLPLLPQRFLASRIALAHPGALPRDPAIASFSPGSLSSTDPTPTGPAEYRPTLTRPLNYLPLRLQSTHPSLTTTRHSTYSI